MLPALPFQLLERYDVVEEIGRGGHALVYRAHDSLLARDVAIKVLREDVVAPDLVRRFLQEIQLLARLEHAHILHVHDSGTVDGRPFVVMELAPQATLAHRLVREPQLPIADAVQIAREVGSALAHAHARSILHRDVKPENILLGAGGAVLADFGIARVTGEHDISRITSTGEAVGTLAYMSPEQLCAEPMDARSDQYALGCVLYEMLAGVRPHAAATLEGLRALRLTGQQPPVSTYRPAVTPALEGILSRMMAVAAADRFRSMDEFLIALDVLRTTEGPQGGVGTMTPTGRRTPIETSPLPARATSRGAMVAAGAVLAVVASAAVWWATRASADDGGEAPAGALVVALADGDASPAAPLQAGLRAELSAWSGVATRDGALRGGSMRRGVQVTTSMTKLGDSVQLRLTVRDSAGAVPREVRRLVPARWLDGAATGLAPVTASLAREVLAGRALDGLRGIESIPTRSLPALRAFVRGTDLLLDGQLDSAAAAFRAARDAAPGFAAAHLWAAQSAAWSQPRQVTAWQPDVEAALRRVSTIGGAPTPSPLDSGLTLLARGLEQMARRAFPEACATYREAERVDAVRFEALVGLGECQRLDDVVIRTPQGLRFRSSHWGALQAFTRSVDVAPTSGLLGALVIRMRTVTYSEGTRLRSGRWGEAEYFALPSLQGDSLAFVPVSSVEIRRVVPATWHQATRRGRALDVRIMRDWTRRFPMSGDAWLAYASALEGAGMLAMTDSTHAPVALSRAIQLGTAPARVEELRLLRVRLALRRGELGEAAQAARDAIADATFQRAASPMVLSALAILVGDRAALRRWMRPDSLMSRELGAIAADSMVAFETASLLGDCETVRRIRPNLDSVLLRSASAAALPALRARWLPTVLRFAAPCLGVRVLSGLPLSDGFDFVLEALSRADTVGARAQLRRLHAERVGATTPTVTWDRQYEEAWAWLQIGDSASAAQRLTDALDGMAEMSASTLTVPSQAAGLRRSLMLMTPLAAASLGRGRAGADNDRLAFWAGGVARLSVP